MAPSNTLPDGWQEYTRWPDYTYGERLELLTAVARFMLGDKSRLVRSDLEYLVYSGVRLDRGNILVDDLTPVRIARWERENWPVAPHHEEPPYIVAYNYGRNAAMPNYGSRMSFNLDNGVIYATLNRKLFPVITGVPIPTEPSLYILHGNSIALLAEARLNPPQELNAHRDDIELAIYPLPNTG